MCYDFIMFEWKIQKGWEEYRRDFGLGRLALATSIFNTFLFAISFFMGGPLLEAIYPVLFSLIFFLLRERIAKLSSLIIFALTAISITITILLNYYLVGLLDQLSGDLLRYDDIFSAFDLWLYSMPVASFIKIVSGNIFGSYQWLYYDFLQISYMTYYLFPFFGGFFYYSQLSERNKAKIGRLVGSVLIFFNLNYLLYLIVPVTGPQYYIDLMSELSLPMSFVGKYFNHLVYQSHPNFIDCFPSGHAGISILITIWMFKIKNHYRYIFLFFCLGMIQATLGLKYHYTLDVLCAIPFAAFCYWLSYKFIPQTLEVRKNRKWRF